jgi:hypothetical protein
MSIIKINVGGKIYETNKNILIRCEYFKNMLHDCVNDLSNIIFVDCDPDGFKHILEYLRFAAYKIPKKYSYLCDYFLINDSSIYEDNPDEKLSSQEMKFNRISTLLKIGTKDNLLCKCLSDYITKNNYKTLHLMDTYYTLNDKFQYKYMQLNYRYSAEERDRIPLNTSNALNAYNILTKINTFDEYININYKSMWVFIFENKNEIIAGDIFVIENIREALNLLQSLLKDIY